MDIKKRVDPKKQLSFFFLGETVVYTCHFILSFALMLWCAYLNQYQVGNQSAYAPYTVTYWIVSIVYKIGLITIFLIAYLNQKNEENKYTKSILRVWAIGYLVAQIIAGIVFAILKQPMMVNLLQENGWVIVLILDQIFPIATVLVLAVSYLVSKQKPFILFCAVDFILYLVLFLILKTVPQPFYTLDNFMMQPYFYLTTLNSLVLFITLLSLGIAFKTKHTVQSTIS